MRHFRIHERPVASSFMTPAIEAAASAWRPARAAAPGPDPCRRRSSSGRVQAWVQAGLAGSGEKGPDGQARAGGLNRFLRQRRLADPGDAFERGSDLGRTLGVEQRLVLGALCSAIGRG